MRYAVVLAAGMGTRMQSEKNKVMHKLMNKPVIGHVVDRLESINIEKTVVVVGHQNESIKEYLKDRVEYAEQTDLCGTANALKDVKQLENKKGSTLVIFGDAALVQADTLNSIYEAHEGNDLTIITSVSKNPGRYNRVIRDNQGYVEKIVKVKDATRLEATSNEINLGVYVFNNELLYRYLDEINDTQEELNIVDIVTKMRAGGHTIQAIRIEDESEFKGVNDRVDMATATKWLKDRINMIHMINGVTIVDPDNTYIGSDVKIEADVVVHPNVNIFGKTTIKKGSEITSGSWIENAEIGENTLIDASKVINSKVGNNTTVGPYAHIREHSDVRDHVRVGNFVELKTTKLDNYTSSAHLSYLGNANIGKYVNIGCGVVTINYDGQGKFETEIGDYSFVGSNASLQAPLKIGTKAVVAAGSFIKDDVNDGEMAISRATQTNKEKSGENYLNKKGKI